MEKISFEKKTPLEEKKLKLEAMRKVLENTGDALGRGLDKGIVETCALLNILGYPTSGSCDGHGTHCAYLCFNTPTGQADDENPNSAMTIVSNDSRKVADEKLIEKFGKNYIESLTSWPDNVSDYWDEVRMEIRDNHPLHEEYQKSVDAFFRERDDLVARITDLKNEFLDSIGEPRDSMYVFDNSGRLEFLSENEYHNEILTKETVDRSSWLLHKFETFLKEKYLKS